MSEPDPRFPNLYLVGAMKAATSSVYQVLAAHPEIFMSPVKEPKYFAFVHDRRRYRGPRDPDNNRHWVDRERYLELFAAGRDRRILGEASTVYLYHPDTASNIARAAPQARIVAILRDPAERAYSHYCFLRQRGRERETTFERALARESERIAAGWGSTWHYRRMGHYVDQVRRYLAAFPREQVLLMVYDDLRAEPGTFYSTLSGFLDVAATEQGPAGPVYNRTLAVRSPAVASALLRLRDVLPPGLRASLWRSAPWRALLATLRPLYRLNFRELDPAPRETLAELRAYYRPEVERLEDLLERDLRTWRDGEAA